MLTVFFKDADTATVCPTVIVELIWLPVMVRV
jgi:hypothetical protein